MKRLKTVDMKKCIGCYSCSLACAREVHKSLSWTRSGIHIKSSGGISTGFEAIFCLACHQPPCANVCPTGALKPRKMGGVLLIENQCIGCGDCEKACLVGAIYFDNQLGKPIFCFHCGKCVNFCPHNCLTLEEVSHDR